MSVDLPDPDGPIIVTNSPVSTRKGRVIADVVPNTKRKTLNPNIEAVVEPGSTIYTDALRSYDGLAEKYEHETVDHAKEYVRGNASTNTIDGYFSIFKRGLIGTYHHVGAQHLQRYSTEFDFKCKHPYQTWF